MNTETLSPEKRQKLGRLFFAMFVLALVMGPGPGIYLINPDPADPEAKRFLFGIPIIYVWASFWFLIQGSAVVLSYLLLWKTTPETAAPAAGDEATSTPDAEA